MLVTLNVCSINGFQYPLFDKVNFMKMEGKPCRSITIIRGKALHFSRSNKPLWLNNSRKSLGILRLRKFTGLSNDSDVYHVDSDKAVDAAGKWP